MNLSSRTAAGRSRSADEGAFLRPNVVHTTGSASSAHPAASPHAWKRVLQERIWSPHGPKGLAARSVLMLLVWHADASGRTWLGIQTIANKIGAGSLRTIRNALDALVRDGWLRSTPQTWASLTTEQTSAGRPTPRRGDVGQAPNLYVVLDGRGNAVSSDALSKSVTLSRPRLARVTSFDLKSIPLEDHCRNDQRGPGQKEQGEPLADLHGDLDPKGSRSWIESAERVSDVGPSTHNVSEVRDEGPNVLGAWSVIVEAHADKTKAVYGLPPLPPDLKRDQQQALAECLEGAAADVCAKLRERTGIERDVRDMQRELATRVMQLYFKRDNEHLRRVKHALRDLPREFHARITEAMQMLLRESHDAQKPRPTQSEKRFVETTKPAERPITLPQAEAAQVNTAREARRLLEVLGAAPTREEGPPRQSVEPMRHDKPTVQDKPIAGTETTARPGAPRWGAVGPRPVKVRTALSTLLDGLEGDSDRDETVRSVGGSVPGSG